MDYSCTTDASYTLGIIGHMFATDGNPNVLTIRGERYFFERGREQSDGAITGTLMLMLPDDYCRKVGTVRIEPDGRITRFPKLSATEKQEVWDTLHDLGARNPHLLSAWAMGRI
jgi:hypothetical protein